MDKEYPNEEHLEQIEMIEFHLDLMPREDRANFARQLEENGEQQRSYEDLTGPLGYLDGYKVQVPTDLQSRIHSAVKTTRLIREQVSAPAAAGQPKRERWRIPLPIRDLLAAAASIMIVSSLWLATSTQARHQAYKVLCASKLGTVGSALSTYATSFPDQLPRAAVPKNFKWYDAKTGRVRRPHLFLLVKTRHLRPETLACPAAGPYSAEAVQLDQLNDFLPSMVVSYSFQNLSGDRKFSMTQLRRRWLSPTYMAIMADQTPLFQNNRLLSTFEPLSSSRNHRGLFKKGQNILTLDGSVNWQRVPLIGANEDNIWQSGDLRKYTGTEVPSDSTDAFLAP